MPKVKIEDTLPSGEKISLTIESGEFDEARLLQMLSMLKTLKESQVPVAGESNPASEETLKERIWRVIIENFSDGTWFSLRDLYNLAAKEIPGLRITAASTYVTRLVNEGRLRKRGTKPNTRYRVRTLPALRNH